MTEKRRRVRRREVPPRFFRTRRFRITALLSLLAVLLLVNGVVIWLQSPKRRKYRFYEDGLSAYSRGDHSEASILFRRFLDLEPKSTEGHYMLGLTLFRLGRDGEAVRELGEAIRRSPDFDPAHLALADHYRRVGDFRSALRSAKAALRRPPAPARAFALLGEVKLELGDADGAIEAFRRSLETDPDQIEPNLKLGDLYLSRERQGLADVKEGLAAARYRRAVELAEANLAARPEDTGTRLLLAKALAGVKDFRRAEDLLKSVIRAEPGKAEHRILLARFHLSRDDEDRFRTAEEDLSTAWKETPSPEVAVTWAEVVGDLRGEGDRAISILEEAVTAFPDEASLRIALVGRLLREGRSDRARKVLGEARNRFPRLPALTEAEGDLQAATGDPEGARSAYEAVLEVRPQAINVRRKLIELLLPAVLESIGRGVADPPERARLLQHLAFFLDPRTGINPADLRARRWMARLRFVEGDFEAVNALLGGADRPGPTSFVGLRILGLAELRTGDDYAAARALYRAVLHPDSPGTPAEYEDAFQACHRVGSHRREVAIAARAVEKWPDDLRWRLRLARSYFRDGQLDLALSTCRIARKMAEGTDDVRGLLLAARIHQHRGEVARARAMLEEAVTIRRDAETRGALYRFLAETGDTKLAREGFLALVAENPTDPGAFLRFGDFLFSRKDPEGALEQYEKVLSLAPGHPDAIRRIAELRIALAPSSEEAIRAAEEAVKRIRTAQADDPHALYFVGKLHLLRGEPAEAVRALTAYIRAFPEDAAGVYYLAVAQRRSGDLKAARDGFLSALNLDPEMTEAKLELASLYFTEGLRARWRGEPDQAAEAFRQVTRLDPDEPYARRYLVGALARLGKLDEAAAQAEAVLCSRPDDPGALFILALRAARKGDFEKAAVGFRKLVTVAPDNYRGHLYLGLTLTELRNYDAARESFRTAWEQAPGAREVLHAIASLELLAGNVAEAIRLVQAERDRRPKDAFLHHLLGDLYREAGRSDDAIRAYRRAFDLDPGDTAALAMAAAVMADAEEMEEAVSMLRKGEARASRTADLKTFRGRMLFRLGRRDEAELAFREAIAEGGAGSDPLRELGLLLLDEEKTKEGVRVLERAVELGLTDPVVFFRLALAAASRGDLDRAEEEYRKVLRLVPEDPATLNNLALVLSRVERRREEAVGLARRAAELKPDSPFVADTLGWVLYRSGEYEEAAKLLKTVAAKLPGDASVQFHAGMACFRAYLWEDARPLLRRALELKPEPGEAEQAKKALREMG